MIDSTPNADEYLHRDRIKLKRVLVSVSDKTGLVELCQQLVAVGVEIVSTGNTATTLEAAGVAVVRVEQITAMPEFLGGRVKTLHPMVHAGILADLRLPAHQLELANFGAAAFDAVIVNLYPFREALNIGAGAEALVNQIDIGGPAMLRGAAKNFANVAVVTSPDQYPTLISASTEGISLVERRQLAAAAFAMIAKYDALIAEWMLNQTSTTHPANQPLANPGWPAQISLTAKLDRVLRYGENAHQTAALYKNTDAAGPSLFSARQLGGKPMSFNNWRDTEAAMRIAAEFDQPAVAIVKHLNPCGVALALPEAVDPIADAHARAHFGDSVSAFGGIIAANRKVTVMMAKQVAEVFTEVIVAPGYELEALAILLKSKNLRILELPGGLQPNEFDYLQVAGGWLVQQPDQVNLDQVASWKLVSGNRPIGDTITNLEFAWKICKHVKSNAIVLARDLATVGIGMGQVNRLDSCRLAIDRSNSRSRGSVAASDAFFPFADGLELLIKAGVKAVVQPGGSTRDAEVTAAAESAKLPMFFTGKRHFAH